MHNGLLKMGSGQDGRVGRQRAERRRRCSKHISGEALRFFILSTHYRWPIDLGDWDWKNPATPIPDGLIEPRSGVRDVRPVRRASAAGHRHAVRELPAPTTAGAADVHAAGVRRVLPTGSSSYMDDDFNTGGAVGVLFELVDAR